MRNVKIQYFGNERFIKSNEVFITVCVDEESDDITINARNYSSGAKTATEALAGLMSQQTEVARGMFTFRDSYDLEVVLQTLLNTLSEEPFISDDLLEELVSTEIGRLALERETSKPKITGVSPDFMNKPEV